MNKLLKQAFTLIELLVVIAIIGILSGLIIVGMSGMTQKATIAKLQIFSNSLRNSLMTNIVAEWKFDGVTSERVATNSDVADTWGGVNNGSVPASPNTPTVKIGSDCISGSCLAFDGNDYMNCGLSTIITSLQQGSIALWFKATSDVTNERILFHVKGTGSYFIPEYRDSIVKIDAGANQVNGSTTLQLNAWYFVVYTSNGTTTNIYLNGTTETLSKSGTDGYWAGDVVSPTTMYIGASWSGGLNHTGLIDDVRIYNAAMPTSQIKEQYYAGLNNLLINGNISKEEYLSRINQSSKI